jgi:hypothetical protein
MPQTGGDCMGTKMLPSACLNVVQVIINEVRHILEDHVKREVK